MEKIIEKHGKLDTDFEGIKWAVSVRSKDKDKLNINNIKIDKDLIIATDGIRLHCYLSERHIEDGIYEVLWDTKDMIILRKKEDIIFPNYEAVFPKKTTNGIPDLVTFNNKKLHVNTVLNHILKKSANNYDVEYLLAACPPNDNLHFEESGLTGPLVIRNKDYTKAALLMPLNL